MALSGGNVKEQLCPGAIITSTWHISHTSALFFHSSAERQCFKMTHIFSRQCSMHLSC